MSTFKELFEVSNEPVAYEGITLTPVEAALAKQLFAMDEKLDKVLTILERQPVVHVTEVIDSLNRSSTIITDRPDGTTEISGEFSLGKHSENTYEKGKGGYFVPTEMQRKESNE